MNNKKDCDACIREYRIILSDFGISMDLDLKHWIMDTYPNEVKIENHIKSIINDYLKRRK